jgi:hypothetical protein
MHRFTRGLKRQVAFEDCEQKEFACFCFSILVNSSDLEHSKTVFGLIRTVFLSEYEDDAVRKAREALQEIIIYRDNKSVKEIIASIFVDSEFPMTEEQACIEELSNELDDVWYKPTKTIKEASPFSEFFLKIQSESIVIKSGTLSNKLHNTNFIAFL